MESKILVRGHAFFEAFPQTTHVRRQLSVSVDVIFMFVSVNLVSEVCRSRSEKQ